MQARCCGSIAERAVPASWPVRRNPAARTVAVRTPIGIGYESCSDSATSISGVIPDCPAPRGLRGARVFRLRHGPEPGLDVREIRAQEGAAAGAARCASCDESGSAAGRPRHCTTAHEQKPGRTARGTRRRAAPRSPSYSASVSHSRVRAWLRATSSSTPAHAARVASRYAARIRRDGRRGRRAAVEGLVVVVGARAFRFQQVDVREFGAGNQGGVPRRPAGSALASRPVVPDPSERGTAARRGAQIPSDSPTAPTMAAVSDISLGWVITFATFTAAGLSFCRRAEQVAELAEDDVHRHPVRNPVSTDTETTRVKRAPPQRSTPAMIMITPAGPDAANSTSGRRALEKSPCAGPAASAVAVVAVTTIIRVLVASSPPIGLAMAGGQPVRGSDADEHGGRHAVRNARDRARNAGDGILPQGGGIGAR